MSVALVTGATITGVQLVEAEVSMASKTEPALATGQEMRTDPAFWEMVKTGGVEVITESINTWPSTYVVARVSAVALATSRVTGSPANETPVRPPADGATMKLSLASSCVPAGKVEPMGRAIAKPTTPV